MNTNGMPEINTAWDRVMDSEIKRVLQESTNKVNYELQEIVINRMPMTSKQLITIERSVRKRAFRLLHDPNIKNAPKDKLIKLQEDFTTNIDETFEGLFKENESISKAQAKDLLPRMYQKIKLRIKEEGYETIQGFNEDFNKMAVSYLNNTKDPENYVILQNFIMNYVFEDMDGIMQIQTDKYISVNHEYQTQIAADEERIEDLTNMLQKEKTKIKEKEAELRSKNLNMREDLETEMTTMKSQLQIKESQFKDLENILKRGMENNDKAVREIKDKEIENIKLKLSLESEKKINLIERGYQDKLSHNKKEMKKVFEVTLMNMKSTYEDESKLSNDII
jgi:hypothetical protein